jgi:hypothetical protein
MTTVIAKTFKNPHRSSVQQWREEEGLTDLTAFDKALEGFIIDGVVPAMCDEGCEVEPDGRCEHKCPSILLAMGMI